MNGLSQLINLTGLFQQNKMFKVAWLEWSILYGSGLWSLYELAYWLAIHF